MRLDCEVLRSRRLQLGLSQRGLARKARVTQPLIKRLETTGTPDRMECGTLDRVLDALLLDLAAALATRSPADDKALPIGAGHPAAGCLTSPTAVDVRLLLAALRGDLTTRAAALTKNGNIGLHRLRNAGLVVIRKSGEVVEGPKAMLVFQTAPKHAEPADR